MSLESHIFPQQEPGEVPDNAPSVEHEEPIERLLVAYDVKAGVYGVPCRAQIPLRFHGSFCASHVDRNR